MKVEEQYNTKPIINPTNGLFAKPHDKRNSKIENHKIKGKIIHDEISHHINIKILKFAMHGD